jgi:hypothetical protein
MSMNRPTVLILSSDGTFSREIKANWPRGDSSSEVPEFVVLSASAANNLNGGHYDLAIADGSAGQDLDNRMGRAGSERKLQKNFGDEFQNRVRDKGRNKIRNRVENKVQNHVQGQIGSFASNKPTIVIHSDFALDFCAIQESVIELRREPLIWPAIAGIIGREILHRRQAESRSREVEHLLSVAQAEATLGRFMIEMRTNVNNALTTMLGNAELLAHESGLPARVHAQTDAIRNMALRLNEVFQRFSSLEKELAIAARDPGKKILRAATGRE